MTGATRQHPARQSTRGYWLVPIAWAWTTLVLWSKANTSDLSFEVVKGIMWIPVSGLSLVGLFILARWYARFTPDCPGATQCGITLSGIALSATLTLGQQGLWDAAGVVLSIWVVTLASTRPIWITAVVGGLAIACTPLAAGITIVMCMVQSTFRRRWMCLFLSLAVASLVGLALDATVRPAAEAVSVSSTLARLGPQNVWREAARWFDMVMPVLVLAGMAIADSQNTERHVTPQQTHRAPMRLLILWCTINGVVFLCCPRLAIEHGVILIVPFLFMVPTGWRLFRMLPFTRNDWSISTFSFCCHGLFLLLIWRSVKPSWTTILVALFGT